jgi:hypothetical protein
MSNSEKFTIAVAPWPGYRRPRPAKRDAAPRSNSEKFAMAVPPWSARSTPPWIGAGAAAQDPIVSDRPADSAASVHLFELTPAICEATRSLGKEWRRQTLEGLLAGGLLHLPYPEIAVRFDCADLGIKDRERGVVLTFRVSGPIRINDGDNTSVAATCADHIVVERPRTPTGVIQPRDPLPEIFHAPAGVICAEALTILVLALASKNIVKRNQLASGSKSEARGLEVGPLGRIHVSRTVFEAPELPSTSADRSSHASPRPHKRRGHLHTVRFGRNWSQRRQQWFEPTEVKADPEFTPMPRHFVVKQ